LQQLAVSGLLWFIVTAINRLSGTIPGTASSGRFLVDGCCFGSSADYYNVFLSAAAPNRLGFEDLPEAMLRVAATPKNAGGVSRRYHDFFF